jgi:nicotinamidase-related amidase
MRHPALLDRHQAALLVIDIQARVHAVMCFGAQVEGNAVKLIRGFQILRAPLYVTEQYPQGLGPTIPAVAEALAGVQPLQKMSFSCCGNEALMAGLKQGGIHQLVLCGIETHVCVSQTAHDLLAQGFQVHVARDAVSSRRESDHGNALERMRAAGAIITTTEAALFELMVRADIAEFKSISALVK